MLSPLVEIAPRSVVYSNTFFGHDSGTSTMLEMLAITTAVIALIKIITGQVHVSLEIFNSRKSEETQQMRRMDGTLDGTRM